MHTVSIIWKLRIYKNLFCRVKTSLLIFDQNLVSSFIKCFNNAGQFLLSLIFMIRKTLLVVDWPAKDASQLLCTLHTFYFHLLLLFKFRKHVFLIFVGIFCNLEQFIFELKSNFGMFYNEIFLYFWAIFGSEFIDCIYLFW